MASEQADGADIQPPPGVILPPKEVRELLEKTAEFVGRRGPLFAQRIEESASTNHKLQFALASNPYNAFYLWRISEIKEGRGLSMTEAGTPLPQSQKTNQGPTAPADFEFSARMPTINAVDLDIVKLTALFTAKNGRQWMTALSQREARNYQFDFLRPQHSYYQYFDRLVSQYKELLTGDSVDNGKPQKRKMDELEHNVQDKYHILERARRRAEWVKYQGVQKVKKEEEAEVEKISYAQIDWHDFVVVGTIDFTEADDAVDLPPPTSLNDLQSASLEQKAAMSLAPQDRRLEEAMPDDTDFLAYQAPQQQPPPQPMHMMPPPPPGGPQASHSPAPYAPSYSPADQEEEARIAERTAERERAQQAQAAAKGTGPMRIRNDYVPRAQQARRQAANTVLCQICKQQIASEEYEQHVRIEMLDPRWREQSRIAAQRSSTTNLSTADVAANLKRLASQRSDVFDPVTGQAITDEEAQRRKRVELGSYDGIPAAAGAPGAAGAAGAGGEAAAPLGADAKSADVAEQVRRLHQKYGQP